MKIWDLEKEKEGLLSALSLLRTERKEILRNSVLNIKEKLEREREKAILEFCKEFDGWKRDYPFKLTKKEIKEGRKSVEEKDIEVLKGMIERVKKCIKPVRRTKKVVENEGVRIEEDKVPIERLLIYSPGGKAPYPSSFIMAAIPAISAGVKEIYVTSPAPDGIVNPYILACADLIGIENVYRLGGAQAIFAFAEGIGEIPKVDMIVGPGNAYVEEAKKECFGSIGIDTIAGPSELLVFANDATFPDLVARDLLSQAEHDEMAVLWLFSKSENYVKEVYRYMEIFGEKALRKGIIRKVLSNNTFFVLFKEEENAIDTVNQIAPEHVELIGGEHLKEKILYSGITYIGITTPVALGDYYIGTNHILPTGGSGRFLSGLSVETFLRRRVVVKVDPSFLRKYGDKAQRMAEIEGLYCHKEAIQIRKERIDEIEDWISKG
jgi:histidinol dehydrogenase